MKNPIKIFSINRNINYLHYAHKSCRGYENYLESQKSGKWLKLFPEFLLLQGLIFIYYKMHKEAFAYIILMCFLLSIFFVNPLLSVYLAFFTYITTSLIFYKLYEMHIDREIVKCIKEDPLNYSNLFLKKMEVSSIPTELIKFTFFWIVYGAFAILTLMLFSSAYIPIEVQLPPPHNF